MLAIDSSTFIHFLRGEKGADVDVLAAKALDGDIVLPSVAVAEMFSHPHLTNAHQEYIRSLTRLEITHGYWERAGLMRARLIKLKMKPKLPDTLIAQSCIDYGVPLLTRDKGFTAFEKHCGLKLYKAA